MGRTIIQPIGPLYGEAVNGTVFGRPNGSVYVPSSNTIDIKLIDEGKYIRKVAMAGDYDRILTCKANGTLDIPYLPTIVAESQDNAAYIETAIYSDAELTTMVGIARSNAAGNFNITLTYAVGLMPDADELTQGDTYYLVATLKSGTGVAVATDIVAVEGVVVS